jgi:ubiquinone/menaquinone biosynthesis C-methylase UbiE
VADVNHLPYLDHTFDFILCSDVFECVEVDEQKAYAELLRVLKPGGHILLLAAAFQFLLSEHDKAVHSVRRYSRPSAIKAFQNSKVKVDVHFYFAFSLGRYANSYCSAND